MKKYLFAFFSLFNICTGFCATGEGCKNHLVSQLSSKLESANINPTSPTLERELRLLLLPEMDEIIEHHSECASVKHDLLDYSGTEFSVNTKNHQFDITLNFTDSLVGTNGPNVPDEMESVLPWYGILVVQKGSLDNYANADIPVISTEYMKQNKSKFFPANSNKLMGMARACTHGNHMAHDKDVINRATHQTMGEQDSFWKGNDFYVYDGEDVYWGWASLAGEVALALVTLGISAEAQAAGAAVTGASKAVASARVTRNAAKLKKAATAAKAAKKGTSAAAQKSRTDAIKALAEAGVKVKDGTRASELIKIGTSLEKIVANGTLTPWKTALGQPWKMVKPGITTLNPKNAAKVYGHGVTWGQRIKRGGIQATVAAAGAGTANAISNGTPEFLIELAKAFGYSSATYRLPDNIKFNAFGLLSGDDLVETDEDGNIIKDRRNEVSHGAWLQFLENGESAENAALNEALRFAEEFTEDVQKANDSDPLCKGLDIYVVQPAISNPEKMNGKREVYYIIQNPAGSLRVE